MMADNERTFLSAAEKALVTLFGQRGYEGSVSIRQHSDQKRGLVFCMSFRPKDRSVAPVKINLQAKQVSMTSPERMASRFFSEVFG